MKKIVAFGSFAALAACSHPAAVVAPKTAVMAAPTALVQPQPQQVQADTTDPQLFAKVFADLKVLGYLTGKNIAQTDPAFARAIIAFQKDHGLAQDGVFSPSLATKIHAARAVLRSAATPIPAALYLYAGRTDRRMITLGSAPDGYGSDAKANLYAVIRTTGEAAFQITPRTGAAEQITCHVAKTGTESFSVADDGVGIDCTGVRGTTWHDVFSPRLGVVVSRRSGNKVYALMAIRPLTNAWPYAARTGLDWAISAALSAPAQTAPIKWSSTGVSDKYEIRAGAPVKLPGQGNCRHFDLLQETGGRGLPAIACRANTGEWLIPGTGVKIAGLMRAAVNSK